jgi:two-component system LytT family response regulator
MPDLDGFGVIQALDAKELPLIIFVTAHEKFALKAFEVSAVDYLLKPFDKERFDRSLEKALRFLHRENELEEKIGKLLKAYEQSTHDEKKSESFIQKILIKESKRIFFIPVNEIYFFEAAGDYLVIHTENKKYMIHESMNAMEQKLDPVPFSRIHRSTIINIDFIKEMQPHFNGEFHVTMKNGAVLKLSRSYREQAKKIFGEN